MALLKTTCSRRSFLKATALAGGGLMISFSCLTSCQPAADKEVLNLADEWFALNGFLKIGDNGLVTIMSPNPEGVSRPTMAKWPLLLPNYPSREK